VDIHGSYLSNTSTWMWSVLSMDIQLDIHPLPSLYLIADLSGEVEEIHRWCLVRVQPWAEAGDGRNSECGGREEEIQ
jgi:hypothetical protein